MNPYSFSFSECIPSKNKILPHTQQKINNDGPAMANITPPYYHPPTSPQQYNKVQLYLYAPISIFRQLLVHNALAAIRASNNNYNATVAAGTSVQPNMNKSMGGGGKGGGEGHYEGGGSCSHGRGGGGGGGGGGSCGYCGGSGIAICFCFFLN
jgi:hypothetical protein